MQHFGIAEDTLTRGTVTVRVDLITRERRELALLASRFHSVRSGVDFLRLFLVFHSTFVERLAP